MTTQSQRDRWARNGILRRELLDLYARHIAGKTGVLLIVETVLLDNGCVLHRISVEHNGKTIVPSFSADLKTLDVPACKAAIVTMRNLLS